MKKIKWKGKDYNYESVIEKDDDDYYYGVELEEDNIIITRYGVSIDHPDGSSTTTNIMPATLFPKATWKLTKAQIIRILDTVEGIGGEGKIFSKEEMELMFKEMEKEDDDEKGSL